MAKNLIERVKEKPARYLAQSTLTLIFVGETLDVGTKIAEKINKYEPQIKNFVGELGYWPLQIGLPIVEVGLMAALGYIAIKGAGMFLDKHWYDSNPIS